MAVHVQRGAWLRMPENLGQHENVHPRFNGAGSERVAKAMEVRVWNARCLDRSLEQVFVCARFNVAASYRGEYIPVRVERGIDNGILNIGILDFLLDDSIL